MSGPTLMEDVEYRTGEPRAHHRYYLPDGDVEIQVNNALFRVHRHFLVKHSTVLGHAFRTPDQNASTSVVQEVKEDDMLWLSGDSVVGWESLLSLFYPDNPCKAVVLTAEEWAQIVLLANKYVMEGIEIDALSQLRKANPPLNLVDFMVLAQKVDSRELYREAVDTLARQNEIMSFEDARKIGLKAFHDVMRRERLHFKRSKIKGQKPSAQLMNFGDLFYDSDELVGGPPKRRKVSYL